MNEWINQSINQSIQFAMVGSITGINYRSILRYNLRQLYFPYENNVNIYQHVPTGSY